jgi:flagellar motor switch protein FliM
MLQGVHEGFAKSLETSLSSFLQKETKVSLGEISFVTLGDYRGTLVNPTCLIAMRLHPRQDSMLLHLDSPTVFKLLEFLLGGAGGATPPAPRELTEIEWSLLEEVVRVVVRPLGESWRGFHETEFEVDSLQSDPSSLPCPDPMRAMIRIAFTLQIGEQTGGFEIAVPEAFFETAAGAEERGEPARSGPAEADLERNLALLGDAGVQLEVRLQGPTMEFEKLLALRAGQVVTFDYPLDTPLKGWVNGTVAIPGYIVSSGRKRAFQVEEPL